MTAIVPLFFSFLCVLLCSHNVLSYDYCTGTDQCTGSRIWCCRVPDQYNFETRKCCSKSCSVPNWNNFCVTEPSPPPSGNPTSTVVVVVPTIIVILIITGIVVIVVRICCCARRPPPSVARPQQTVTVIRSGVTSPPMQHNPYQTGGVGIHPPPMTSTGYNNSGFVPATYAQGNPGQTYPPVSTAYPPMSTGYPPAVSAGYQTQANLAPPPPYSQTDPNSKQPAFNPGNY